jgi:ABC-type transporter Mla MlaB component
MEDSHDTASVLRFTGALTLSAAEAVRSSLLVALEGNGAVRLDCSGATDVDVSFVQMVLAARRAAGEQGKSVSLAAPAAGALLDALRRGGFLDPAREPASLDEAFWTGGSAAL